MNTNVTISFDSPRAAVAALLGLLTAAERVAVFKDVGVEKGTPVAPKPAATGAAAPAPTASSSAASESQADKTPAELRAAVGTLITKIAAKDRPKAVALLAKHQAAKLPAVKDEQLAAVYADAVALAAELGV